MLEKVPVVGTTVGPTEVAVVVIGATVVVVVVGDVGSPLQPFVLHFWAEGHALQSWPTEHRTLGLSQQTLPSM